MKYQDVKIDRRLFEFSTYMKTAWDMKADIFGWAAAKGLPLLSMTSEGVIVWWAREHLKEMDRVGAYKCSLCLSRRGLHVHPNPPIVCRFVTMLYQGDLRNFYALLHPHCWVKVRRGDYGLRTMMSQGGGCDS